MARRTAILRGIRVLLLVIAAAAALAWILGQRLYLYSPGITSTTLLVGPGGIAALHYATPGDLTITPVADLRLEWWHGVRGLLWLPRIERWPTGDWWIAMPFWFLMALSLAGAWTIGRVLRPKLDPTRCACGYSRAGLRENTACPECGEVAHFAKVHP